MLGLLPPAWVRLCCKRPAASKKASEVKSGRTKLDRSDSPVVIENKQALVPVHGFSLVTGKLQSGKGTKGRKGRLNLPPQLKTGMTYRFRGYFNGGNGAGYCSRASLAAACGFIALGSTTGACIVTSYRIRRITIWPVTNDTSPAPSVAWLDASGTAEGALSKDEGVVEPRVSGITEPQHYTFVPPKGELHSMWQTPAVNGSDRLMVIRTGGNAVALFEADVVQVWGNIDPISPGTFTGGTSGRYYRYSLDDNTSGNLWHSETASIF